MIFLRMRGALKGAPLSGRPSSQQNECGSFCFEIFPWLVKIASVAPEVRPARRSTHSDAY